MLLLKKLSLYLAVLLCGVLAISVGTTVTAAPFPTPVAQENLHSADEDTPPFTLMAGEMTSGGSEVMLQLDKALFMALIATVLQQLYANSAATEAIPAYPYFKRNCGLYTVLTQGP